MATQTKLLPDGSKVYFDDTNPSVQYKVNEQTGDQQVSQDGGTTWGARPDVNPNAPDPLADYLTGEANKLGQTGSQAASTLAKNAPLLAIPGAGGAAAATGGSTGIIDSLLKVAPALSDIFSKAGASDVAQSNTADQLKIALLNAGINAKKLGVTAPATRLATGERAALAQAATPAQVHWDGPGSGLKGEVPTYTGGIKSIFDANQNPTMKALSNQVLNDSLVGEMSGGVSGGNQDASLGSAANVGQGSTAGDVLGGLGLGTSVTAALAKLGIFGKGPTPTTPTYGPADPDPYGLNS